MVMQMKYCNDCKVRVKDNTSACPLCNNGLTLIQNEESGVCFYPPKSLRKKSYSVVKRIFIFLTITAGALCLLINFMRPEPMLWSLIVVVSLFYAWITVPHFLRKGGNYAGKIFTQVVCGSGLVVSLDFLLGWYKWSVNYVIPVLLCVGIAAVSLVVLLNATNWARYVMYQVLLSVFGFVPLVLYFLDISQNQIFALITTGFAVSVLVATFVFGDRTIKNEFKRRLRF